MYYTILILIICALIWRVNAIRDEVEYKKAMIEVDRVKAENSRRHFEKLLEDHADVRAPLLADIEKLKATIVEKDQRIEQEKRSNREMRLALDRGEDWGSEEEYKPNQPNWPFPLYGNPFANLSSEREVRAAYERAVLEFNIWKNTNPSRCDVGVWEMRLRSISRQVGEYTSQRLLARSRYS